MARRIPQADRTAVQRRLRRLRIAEGLTQTQLSVRLGRLQSYVSKYESGERQLYLLEVREVCRALGATLERFVRELERDLK